MLRAAAAILEEEGPTGVTHQRVAERAGVGRATAYRHWPQPVDLFKKRYQTDLASAFSKLTASKNVPFPFGYNWRTRGNSFVIVARRA